MLHTKLLSLFVLEFHVLYIHYMNTYFFILYIMCGLIILCQLLINTFNINEYIQMYFLII